MVLNDIEIRNRVLEYQKYDMKQPLITPFNESQLQGASYDLKIDDEIVFIKQVHSVIDIKDKNHIEAAYNKETIGNNGFVLMPNTFALISLKEILSVPPDLSAHFRPKTRYNRIGLYVQGQHINPDSICKLNIGLYNMGFNPIRLYKGISVVQIVFEQMINTPSPEKLYRTKKDAHYSEDIDFVGAKFEDEFSELVDITVNKLLNME